MSLWRREASERLPELQGIIASRFVDGPMMLWIELNTEFEKLCGSQPPPIDLLRRIWRYCDWCLQHGGEDVRTAAALGFGEHLIDSPQRAALLPSRSGISWSIIMPPLKWTTGCANCGRGKVVVDRKSPQNSPLQIYQYPL